MQSNATIVKKTNRRVLFQVIVYVVIVVGVMVLLFRQKNSFKEDMNTINYADIVYPITLSGDIDLNVYIADDDYERSLGLSKFQGLKDNEAMLFIFDEPSKYPFWMKSMNFSIDIIWLDTQGTIVYVKENAQPSDYPNAYYPNKDAQYVMEFNAGFVQNNSLKIGDTFRSITQT